MTIATNTRWQLKSHNGTKPNDLKIFSTAAFFLFCCWQAWAFSSLSLSLITPLNSFIHSPQQCNVSDSLCNYFLFFLCFSFHFLSTKPLHSKDSAKKAFSLRPKIHNWNKSHKNSAPSSALPTPHKHSSDTLSSRLRALPHGNDTNLFLEHHSNGGIQGAVQDAPLALITKPRSHSSTPSSKPLLAATSPPYPMPINLSTGTKEMTGSSASPLKSSASSGLAHRPRKTKTPKSLKAGKSLHKTNSPCLPVDLVRSSESDINSSKDSEDSLGDDDDEDDIEDEDSGSSLSG